MRKKEGERFIDTWALSSSFLFLVWQDAASCRLAGARSSVYTQASDPPLQTYSWYDQERGGSEEERGDGRIWTDKQRQVKERDRDKGMTQADGKSWEIDQVVTGTVEQVEQ